MALKNRFKSQIDSGRVAWHIAALALATSMAFCFVVYPRIARRQRAVLDSDHYGRLGINLACTGTLTHYSSGSGPTVDRGPGYPFFVAATWLAGGGRYPWCVQGAQCVLFSLTCLLVFATARRLWNPRVAAAAALLCAMHPLLLWYTSRIWVETPASFLFVAVVAACVNLHVRASLGRAVLLGLILGVACLSKSTFLPLVVLGPLGVLWVRDNRVGAALAMASMVTAAAVIAPWTARNAALTGRFIPVHLVAGYNFRIGDGMMEHFSEAPFSFEHLWTAGEPERNAVMAKLPGRPKTWQWEVARDRAFLSDSLTRYARDPAFLAKKAAMNAWWFWTLGQTPRKTAALAVMQAPLVILFAISAVMVLRRKGFGSIHTVPIVLVGAYYLAYLPMAACARYSMVLVATMVMYAVAAFSPRQPTKETPCRI